MNKFAMFGVMLLAATPTLAQTLTPEGPAANTSSASALASTASAPKAPASKTVAPATTEARVQQRIAQMHQRLKITQAQQPAWDAFAQVMLDNVTSMEQAYKDRRVSVATLSAPENMRNFAQIEQARTDGIQKLATSFQTLYDGMSDDQKKTADAMFRHYEDRGGPRNKASKQG